MLLTLDRLARYRPWLYHLTSRANLEAIRAEGALHSAAALLDAAGRRDLLRERRPEAVTVHAGGYPRSIRDQGPLYAGNIRFDDGADFGDLIKLLNSLVFFWPGTEAGPSVYGQRHFERYEGEGPVILRFPTIATLDLAGPETLRLCRYNSGAPRWSGGRASPRGRNTFVRAEAFTDGVSRVVEVTFTGSVPLPAGVEIGTRPRGPFRPLSSP